jgi:hypothetical protein
MLRENRIPSRPQAHKTLKVYMQLIQTVSRDHFMGLLPNDTTTTVVCIEQV